MSSTALDGPAYFLLENIMIRTSSLIFIFLLVACSGPEQEETVASAEPEKVFKWRMVTTWPKNLPGPVSYTHLTLPTNREV